MPEQIANFLTAVFILVASGAGVIAWAAIRQGNKNDSEIAGLKSEIANLKEGRTRDGADLNRRFDEVKGQLGRIENMLGEVLLHRRAGDSNHS